jgi:TPP-dependent pyruvate/acetoin dehydrogenase alpha subunit
MVSCSDAVLAEEFHAPPALAPSVSGWSIEQLYEQMVLIRRFEESLLELFAAGQLLGTTHTCIGQEANAVGVLSHLEHGRDVVVSNHRCHGHYLAFTGDVDGLLCEVMGREGGVCGGKGGSQHLCNDGFYSNGVLGSTIPVATGIALAERERRSGALTVAFLGDGALGQGVVYESFNMASLWELPILFVVENNFYAQSTPIRLGLAGEIAARGRAFGIKTAQLATTDSTEIQRVAGAVISRIRRHSRPFLLVLDTYRLSPHSKGDDVRDAVEIQDAWTRDPLHLAAAHVPSAVRSAVDAACEQRLTDAIQRALAAPPARPLG